VYLGPSWAHARSVGLIISLTMGLVSPQFHVKYDNSFESVKRLKLANSLWQQKCHFVSPTKAPPKGKQPPTPTIEGGSSTPEEDTQIATAPTDGQGEGPLPLPLPLEPMLAREPVPKLRELPLIDDLEHVPVVGPQVQPPIPVPAPPAHDDDATCADQIRREGPVDGYKSPWTCTLIQVMESVVMGDANPILGVQPLLAYAISNDPDILTVNTALKAPDAKEFRAEMSKEFYAHTDKGHWVFVQSDSLPVGTKVLPCVWAMQ